MQSRFMVTIYWFATSLRHVYINFLSCPFIFVDINECENQEAQSCYGICLNFPGTFQCQCPDGTYGDPFIKGGCVTILEKLGAAERSLQRALAQSDRVAPRFVG
jgi:hypothetical protein